MACRCATPSEPEASVTLVSRLLVRDGRLPTGVRAELRVRSLRAIALLHCAHTLPRDDTGADPWHERSGQPSDERLDRETRRRYFNPPSINGGAACRAGRA